MSEAAKSLPGSKGQIALSALKRRLAGLALFLAGLATGGFAEPINPLQEAAAILPLMRRAPAIDGSISEDEWSDAVRVAGVVDHGSGALHPRMATCWFGCDGRRIYAAVKSEMPPIGELSARVRKKDGPVWNDDSIEIWLSPPRSKKPEDQSYIQMIGNPIGTIFDVAFVPGGSQGPWDGDWEFKNSMGDGWWSSEASVSLEALGVTAEDLNHDWRVNVCRSWGQPTVYTSWAPSTGGFSNRDAMARVRWDESAPVVQVLSLGSDPFAGKVDMAVAVRNPTDRPMDVKVHLELQPAFFMPITQSKALNLKPGAQETLHLAGNMDPRKHAALLRVTSLDGSQVYFNRAFAWDKRPAVVWAVGEHEAKAVDFQIAYYPYYWKVRASVDITGLTAAESMKKASFVVTRKDGAATAESGKGSAPLPLAKGELTAFTNKKGECIIEMPDLPTGTYSVTMKLEGGQGVPTETYQQSFERKVFEWEHNKLGTSRVVVPPFTPLKVKGKEVQAILRTHTMNGQGFWDQVVSKGEPILAAPIRLEAFVRSSPLQRASEEPAKAGDYEQVRWKTKRLRFVEKSPDRVRTDAKFSAGPIKARLNSDFDYDGMMKVTLELSPKSDDEIQSLTLVIPLKNEIGTLMHASVDGVLANPAGAIPAGEGVVWDSTKTQRSNTYGTWIPYLWIGGPERGVCWFSDTDRDWVLDDNKPAIDLFRKDGAVTLRVHLINTPTKLTRTHRIVFGLQATPVKPLPEGWRKWAFLGEHPKAVNFNCLWSGTVWGGLDDFHSLYPRDYDFTIWQKYKEARETGNRDWEFVRAWQKKGEEMGQNNANAVIGGMSLMQPGFKVILYIDPRNGSSGEETKYFAAEQFGMEPVASWRDFALFCINKMFDYGFDGVFLDETYLRANFDTVSSDAYVRPDGNVQPSMGLFSMRELCKRIAVLCHERGRPNYTISHLTNSNIVPARSFTAMGVDWEAAYGATDFQERFSPEYIRAQSAGLQSGLVPAVLGGIITEDVKEKVRLSRTQFGVAVVHEIKIVSDGRTVGVGTLNNILYDFGYGEPDCKVYPYWEPGQPVRIEGPKGLALVLSRPGRAGFVVPPSARHAGGGSEVGETGSKEGPAKASTTNAKALILVVDYGGGGDYFLSPDRSVLGLRKDFQAKDAETGESLPVTEGMVRLPIKKHDFRMVPME